MARDFRQSRFRRHEDIGEDVNPSAYIVNLADCMLVLACGFLVALISAYNVDLSSYEQIDSEQMEEVSEEAVSPEDIQNGSGYVPAGTVYMDPNTGITYWVKDVDTDSTDATNTTNTNTSGASNE